MQLITQSDYEQYIRQKDDGDYIMLLNNLTFSSVFQPIFNQLMQLIGFEALLRIQDEKQNFIRPDRFFADPNHSDEYILSVEFLSRAIHIRNFSKHYTAKGVKLFLNVMPNSLITMTKDLEYVDRSLLFRRLKQLGMAPSDVTFEVIEELCYQNDDLREAVKVLRSKGFHFAIDDFGAGHSDEKRAVELTPDLIKIDRGYLLSYCAGQQEELLHALNLAQRIGARVIVEGVEEEEQYQAMRELGLEFYQGYHFGRPEKIDYWAAHLSP
ncbi:TPA: EAL domain-containing protein [Vibrio vulnificus]|uniref:Diguanylate cyclase/phosphodiesterase domain 2 n=1 Tax=Vibrio vulnificus TaxID=672 RepID=A0AAN1PSR2_VIBVL|nr:EAL domain-containing protein [Vibrio vulnificus]ANN28734.1 Diguanylate cyclase/phosphodiesterase domain 2 (EAL) [Vibrio vulnificus]ARN68109.1 Diguanylate cyclase/phosphodiesterase domain 2 (EAL) [Vibrio vulnificus]AXX62000.1 Diguanylate cyclase/phosphodiesterase domain 2 [Vibrio vulnificus]EID4423614.1 EAL domain-containing protein [Vibrio vulnificus]ELH3005160.1 EAL domain-containing protein [Vibrio vulnificus]